jgi:hypothetical protein
MLIRHTVDFWLECKGGTLVITVAGDHSSRTISSARRRAAASSIISGTLPRLCVLDWRERS